jgi:hypothetical protein
MKEVLESVKAVVEKGRQVEIDEAAVRSFARRVSGGAIALPNWDATCHYAGEPQMIVAYLLVVDSINFCFWPYPGTERWEIRTSQAPLSGYYALAVSLAQAFASGIPLGNADYLAGLAPEKLKTILGGTGELQLLDARAESLNALGRLLAREYQGSCSALVEAAENSATTLVRLLGSALPSFRDVARYDEKEVFFYKRAQLFASDLQGALQGQSWGTFKDIDTLTAFADYKLPQVLRQLGIVRYHPQLAQQVDGQALIAAESPEEVEIRAATVWAVERIRQEVQTRGMNLRAFEIDGMLWHLGQEAAFREKPYHRTVTVFY